ncbi:helix-hairpin-helix domain-containing protein [Candidatus Halobeggiatoa sp. HSG11]|nr:helix-hairpin-helix domain-containing protein [Candidatus Halobeggiatoa sp. HSG11]
MFIINQYFLGFIVFLSLNPVLAIDINTATADELAHELSGIGVIKSQRIVKHREKVGGFTEAEQLLEIRGIGKKTLEKNFNKIKLINIPNVIKPRLKPLNNSLKNQFWNWTNLIITLLSIVCLAIFIFAWFTATTYNKKTPREHIVTTTFTCSNCGKVSALKNIYYEGYMQEQYVDGSLPPGWSCIPNWLGELCDYCFDCSQHLKES